MWFTKPETTNRTIASIILKKEWYETPSFYKREKVWDEWKLTENLWTLVEWKFKKIQTKQVWEWEIVEIILEDENGEYVVSGSWTQIMRNIVNSLAGTILEFKLEKIGIGLYEKQGKDWKMYPRVWVKNNDTQTAWRISLDEQNTMKTETEYKGKKLVDWSKLENTLKWYFDEINGDVKPVVTDKHFWEEDDLVS